MPATSQQQQKLFGLALAVKRGEVPASEVSDEVKAIVDRMSEKDIEDFASTSHKGLPKKVEAQLREIVREIMRERAITELEESYKGNMSDFKYEFPNTFENETGNSSKAIKKISKKGKGYEVRTSIYMSEPEMKKVGDAMGLKLVNYQKSSNIAVTLYESVTEGKKVFSVNPGIGKVKYSISSHDGVKKHKDGSDFYDIKTFKNKVDLEKAIKDYTSKGFKMESVNEAKNDDKYVVIDFHEKGGGFVMTKPGSKKDAEDSARSIRKGSDISKREVLKVSDARKIRGLAGKNYLNEESVNEAYDFKPNKNMNNLMKGRKIKNVVYSDKLGFAIILDNGKFVLIRGHRATPGSEKELELESVNEGASTEEKRIVMAVIKKIAKYRNVPLDYAVGDVIRAAEELERDIQKGKVK